jgi:acetyltransferase-like isoleucine patch superfamily enzyme
MSFVGDLGAAVQSLLRDPYRKVSLGQAKRLLGFARARVVLRGCELGERVAAMGPVELYNRGTVRIGDLSYFLPGILPTRFHVHPGAELIIGKDSGFNYGVSFEVTKRLKIGDRCMFASQVTLTDCVIENDVWVAHGATIVAGVTVGEGAVVSAGTTVTKDVPPRHLAIGTPARNVRLDTLSRAR